MYIQNIRTLETLTLIASFHQIIHYDDHQYREVLNYVCIDEKSGICLSSAFKSANLKLY